MGKPKVSAAGGFPALLYVFRKAREVGGLGELYGRMRSRNACKTCALGMGGSKGGMVNESGRFPEVCKKSVQAQAGDMAGRITDTFIRSTPLEKLESLSPRELESLGRVSFPILAERDGRRFRRLSWDEAMDLVGRRFRETTPDQTFFYASGRSSNEAAFLLQVVARAFGTGNIHNCSYYCHTASGVGLSQVYGSGTSSILLEDLARSDLVVVAGANPASNHPRLITQLMELRRRGGRVIVVNPLKELGLVRFRIPSDIRSLLFGSQISDLYLQPHIGSDVAVFKALLKGVCEQGGLDESFIKGSTEGFDAVREDLDASSWESLVSDCGLSKSEIDRAVEMLLEAGSGIFCWAMGLTHHAHGVDNIVALANLALARGWLGRPGAGLLPIRGHSNVQGVGSVGVGPQIKEAFASRIAEIYGFDPPKEGLGTYDSMVASHEGKIRAAFLLGGNLFSSNPDRDWAREALDAVDFKVHVSTKLNEGHVHGRGDQTLILPVLARDEEEQATTQESMFNFVRLSEGGVPSVAGELLSEVEIITSFAERVLPRGRFDWSLMRDHRTLRKHIAQTVPGYGPIENIDTTGNGGGEFQIKGRTFHEPKFNTPSGRAQFRVTPLPEIHYGAEEFRLMTVRSEGQFNTVVYEEEDLYRGNTRRDVVMLSQEDADRLDVVEGSLVEVSTETGAMRVVAAIVDIRSGNIAMYYPEANILVPRRLDRRSGTPAFKGIAVRLAKVDSARQP